MEVPRVGGDNGVTKINVLDESEFAHMTEADKHLARMGYTQVYKREFGWFSAFSFAVSISGMFATVFTTFSYGVTAGGPASVVWCWLIAGAACMCIALSVAELTSAYPTSGGVYFTCNYLLPRKWVPSVSWVVGWLNLLGQIAGVASTVWGAAQILLAAVSMSIDGYTPTANHTTGVMAALLVFQGLVNSMNTKYLEKCTSTYVVFHVLVLVSAWIALLVKQDNKHSAEYVFTEIIPSSGWHPKGFSFLFGFLSVAWTMTDYDATSHITEEVDRPEIVAPWAITAAMTFTYLGGWVWNIILVLCMGDIDSFMNSDYGQPVGQIFYNVLGPKGGIAYCVFALVILQFVGITATHACSRTIWAFARDQMIPLSRVWYKINKKTDTPIYAVWLTIFCAVCINLIGLGSETTIEAIFNITAIALDWSYCIPIACKVIFPNQFTPGPWNMGKIGYFVNAWAVIWTFFVSIIFFMPTVRPVTPSNMNYAVVIMAGVFVFSLGYWFLRGRKFYTGPRANTEVLDGYGGDNMPSGEKQLPLEQNPPMFEERRVDAE